MLHFMVRHRLERLMRLTQGAALVAVAACNSNDSKPADTITQEALPAASIMPSADMRTVNAVAVPPTAMPSASAATEVPAPAASASASASASAATPVAKPPGGTTGAPKEPIHINATPKRPDPPRVNSPNIP